MASFHSQQFVGSGVCAGCHDGLRDASGTDVSLRKDWAPTMMANSARDPFWRAKVQSELSRAPGLSTEISHECTRCHAPMANVEAHADDLPITVFEGGLLDPASANHALAIDGVSCTLCHRISADGLGKPESFTGGYVLSEQPVLFGPYRDVFAMPMQRMVGFTPSYAAHVQRSELCATCHNLKTPVADEHGQLVRSGPVDGFPEQMPYTEWLASEFAQKQSCQDCHMGRTDGVVLSTRPMRLAPRDSFALHGFVGGNRLMLEMLAENRSALGVASDVDFSRVLTKTDALLARAATLELVSMAEQSGVLDVTLRVRNLGGHKLPTSFPSRRVFVHFVVSDESGRVVFESGKMRADGSIEGDDGLLEAGTRFEPHHDVIEEPTQVQIYESVMGDLAGRVTYTLLRGSRYLKDNRVLPRGADKAALPDDIAVSGEALTDADFRGGQDELRYRVRGLTGTRLQVRATLRYQPLGAPFAADLFKEGHPRVQQFARMFEMAPNKAFTLAAVSSEFVRPR